MDQTVPEATPLISIVMLAYNGLPYIKDAVADVLAQTYTNWELIVVDDGSNDGTREWLKTNATDPRIRLYFNEKNLGYIGNKNYGHQLAKGTFITQLDNDDRSTPDRLELLVAAAHANPGIKIFASGYDRIDSEGKLYDSSTLSEDIILTQKPENGYPFWFPAIMAHKSVFEKIGYFNSFFSGALGDDIYWTVKANRQFPIYCIGKALYSYRNNPNSITNSFNNPRKLIMPELLRILFEQQEQQGRDLLEQNDIAGLRHLEKSLENNKIFMAEQYRIWAAKAIDKKDFTVARNLIGKSFRLNFLNKSLPITVFYFLRKRLISPD